MSKPAKTKSLKQRIAKFRLTAANVILGNLANTEHLGADMHDACHIAELCEQYSLFIVLNWLATKYGLSLYKDAIDQQYQSNVLPLLSCPSLADRYTLHLHDAKFDLGSVYTTLSKMLDESFSVELELVGQIYQQCLSAPLVISDQGAPYIDLRADKRCAGEFYTPAWVTDLAFNDWLACDRQEILRSLKDRNKARLPRILDHACGTGNFLLAARRFAGRIYGNDARSVLEFVGRSLFGRDIDGRAVELAKLGLFISVIPEINRLGKTQEERLIQSSSLLHLLDENISVSDSLLAAAAGCKESFDLVISNPPYISFGARDQDKLPSAWQVYLKNLFPASCEYKLRYTSLFQEIGIKLALQKSASRETELSGQCIFLVPDAFLTGLYYQKLRSMILEKSRIHSLTELPEGTIGDATVGRWCLSHYTLKDDKSPLVQIKGVGGADKDRSVSFKMPLTALISPDKNRFQLLYTYEDLEIFEHCRQFGFLGNELKGYTGIRARHGQSKIVSASKASSNHRRGIISGSELNPYRIDWRGNWIEIVPAHLYAGGFDPHVISGPKLLVRQTGDRLVAAADHSGLYHLNNVHSFVPVNAEHRSKLTHYYACLLNSSFYLYYYRLKTREHKRALAQIDIETVEHMPLPPANWKIASSLEELGKNICLQDKQERLSRSKLKNEADELLYRLFGLSKSMQKHINSVIA